MDSAGFPVGSHSLIASLLTFPDIPSKHTKTVLERTVLASVKAHYFMHQVRFGGMYGRTRAVDNRQNDEELRHTLVTGGVSAGGLQKACWGSWAAASPGICYHCSAHDGRAGEPSIRAGGDCTTAEEVVTYSNTPRWGRGCAANLNASSHRGNASEEESQAVPASLVSIATGSNAAAVDSMGRAVEGAVTDVVGAAVNAAVRNARMLTMKSPWQRVQRRVHYRWERL
jgi:hypothetical protein